MVKLLEDNDSEVRLAALEALGNMGPASLDAIRPLERMSRNPDGMLRDAAQKALDAVRDEKRRLTPGPPGTTVFQEDRVVSPAIDNLLVEQFSSSFCHNSCPAR